MRELFLSTFHWSRLTPSNGNGVSWLYRHGHPMVHGKCNGRSWILSRVFPVESAHMATLHAQSKKLSGFWALGALLMRLPVHAVGIPPLTGVTGRVGTENLTHSHDTGEFR